MSGAEAANSETENGSGPAEVRRAAFTGLTLLVLLNIADVALTRMVLARGGIELNPVARFLLASNGALAAKLVIVLLLFVDFRRRGPRVITLCLLWLVAGIYLAVVVVNGSQLVAVWNQ